MRAFLQPTTTLFALSAALTSAIPVEAPPSIDPRNQFCSNAPTTIAGTLLSPRALPPPSPPRPLPPRKSTDTILWCAPLTRTYIILRLLSTTTPPGPTTTALLGALSNAHAFTQTQLLKTGDGLLPQGRFFYAATAGPGAGLDVETWNTNNHQQTWRVLGAALEALGDFLRVRGRVGAGEVGFAIFDGGVEVGMGVVG